MRKRLENKKGFTLAELLIVVAIIAVLVAIAIPVFATELEKSREAVDLANIRAAYAEATTEYLSDGIPDGEPILAKKVGTIHQTKDTWEIKGEGKNGNPVLTTRVNGTEENVSIPDMKKGDTVYVGILPSGKVSISVGWWKDVAQPDSK